MSQGLGSSGKLAPASCVHLSPLGLRAQICTGPLVVVVVLIPWPAPSRILARFRRHLRRRVATRRDNKGGARAPSSPSTEDQD